MAGTTFHDMLRDNMAYGCHHQVFPDDTYPPSS